MRYIFTVTLAVLLALTANAKEFDQEQSTWAFATTEISSVSFKNTSGRTVLRSQNKRNQLEIHAKKIDWDEEYCRVKAEKTDEGHISFTVENTAWFKLTACTADLSITLPTSTPLRIESGTGDLAMKGDFDHIEFATSGATIIEGNIGSIKGTAGSKDTIIKGIAGAVDFTSGAGNVELHFGDADPNTPINIVTGAGNAELFVPQDIAVNPTFIGNSGLVINETASLKSNSPLKVSMKAGSGSLTVKSAGRL